MTLEDFRQTTKSEDWKSCALALLAVPRTHPAISEQFGTYWIEGGHRIREQLADDRLLVRLLRHVLFPYEGSSVILFRGENQERWRAGQIGLAWSADINVARMFGRGLNSVSSGGVLLQGFFEPEAIISGPNEHSRHLGEGQYTVDPTHAENIFLVETFPPTS
jgi:hypothetical protein